MLILTRQPSNLNGLRVANQDASAIVITAPDGSRVVVRLLAIKARNAAAIGIDAPKEWDIRRKELLSRSVPDAAG